MILTKAGLKLWASGLLALAISFAFSFFAETLTFGELTFCVFVLLPLAIGWVQRWFWLPKTEKKNDGFEF